MATPSKSEKGARRSRCVIFSLFLMACLSNVVLNAISLRIHAAFMTPSVLEPSYRVGPLDEFRSGGGSRIVGNHSIRHHKNSWRRTPTSKQTPEDVYLPSHHPLPAGKNVIQFLWGIEGTNDELGMARRRLMRNTCLREFQTSNQPDERICSLLQLLVQLKNGGDSRDENWHNCSIVYTFFVIVTNTDDMDNSYQYG
jgi:hypothetical protein